MASYMTFIVHCKSLGPTYVHPCYRVEWEMRKVLLHLMLCKLNIGSYNQQLCQTLREIFFLLN